MNVAHIVQGSRIAKSLQGHLARGSMGSFGLKIANTAFALIITVLLTRLLGTSDYGAYVFALAWANLLAVPAMLGMQNLLVRYVAVYRAQGLGTLIRGLLRRSNQIVLVVSLSIALLASIIIWALAADTDQLMLPPLWIALIAIPLLALVGIWEGILRGFQRVVKGQMPQMLIRPAVFIVLVLGAYLLGRNLSAPQAVALHVASIGAAVLVGIWLLLSSIPQAVKEATPQYDTREWLRGAMPLFFLSGMTILNQRLDIIMLGMLGGAEATGIYQVAKRGADLIFFVILSVNAVAGPAFAGLHAEENMEHLQRLVTKISRVIFILSLPIAILMILFGHWFLLIFGSDFTDGRVVLIVLCTGYLVSLALGPAGVVLIMTGYGRDALMGSGIGVFVIVTLNLTLIPIWGLDGAAIATVISMFLRNFLMMMRVYKRLGIYTTLLGPIGLLTRT